MKKLFSTADPDFWGILASGACALHCLAIPIAFTMGAFAGLEWLENSWLEWLFILAAAWFAGHSLVKSYRFDHHRSLPLWLAGVGFAWLVVGRCMPHEWEHWLTALGGILITSAHVVNWRFKRCTCQICAAP